MFTVFEEELTVTQIVGLLRIDWIAGFQLFIRGQDILKVDFPFSFKVENHITDSHTHITLAIFFRLTCVLTLTFRFLYTEITLIEIASLLKCYEIFESIQSHHYWEHHIWFIHRLVIEWKNETFEIVATHFRLLKIHVLYLSENLKIWPCQELFTVVDVSGTVKSLVAFPLFEYFALLFLFDLFIDILKFSLHFSNLRYKRINLRFAIESKSFLLFNELSIL